MLLALVAFAARRPVAPDLSQCRAARVAARTSHLDRRPDFMAKQRNVASPRVDVKEGRPAAGAVSRARTARRRRAGRLQGHRALRKFNLREGQDPLAADHRRLQAPQSQIARSVKRARALALLPYVTGWPRRREREGRGGRRGRDVPVGASTCPRDPSAGRRAPRRARAVIRRLQGLPAQLPHPAQARPARDPLCARLGAAAPRPPTAPPPPPSPGERGPEFSVGRC